jgi:hypothetical protein
VDKNVSDIDYKSHTDFSRDERALLYVGNSYRYYYESGNKTYTYNYLSILPTHVTSSTKHYALEMKFKVNTAANDNKEYNLTSYGGDEEDDDYGTLLLTRGGISFIKDSRTTYTYSWAEMGLSAMNEKMTLFVSFKDKIFRVNGRTLEWKFEGVEYIQIDRVFGDYVDYYEDGDYMEFLDKLGIETEKESLYIKAFTHTSYANETKTTSYER